MRNDALRTVMRSIIATVLVFVWVAGALPAYAQSQTQNNTNGSSSNDLTAGYTASQAVYLSDLGLSTAQPPRENPAGHVINKNIDTPLGPNMIVLNQTCQLAGAGLSIGGDNYDIYDFSGQQNSSHAVLPSLVFGGSAQEEQLNDLALLHTSSESKSNWYDAPKAMVGADIDGSGKDDLVIAALPYNSETDDCSLEIIVTNYNGKTGVSHTGSTILVPDVPKPPNYNAVIAGVDTGSQMNYNPVHIVAGDFDHDTSGKDEIAIAVGNILYVASVSVTPHGSSSLEVNATLLWGAWYSSVINSQKDWAEMDLAAADTTGDGYQDLLVTTGSYLGGTDGHIPELLIYSDTPSVPQHKPTLSIGKKVPLTIRLTNAFRSAPKPTAQIPLSLSKDQAFVDPNVAIGDIFGNGAKDIVIAGETETNGKISHHQATSLTYVTYDPATKKYDGKLQHPVYSLAISSSDPNQEYVDSQSMAGLAIASLNGPAGPQFVASGDHVFRWSTNSSSFVDKNVNIEPGNYTMVNVVAGNFLGGKNGREQIAMLYTGNSGAMSDTETCITFISELNPNSTAITAATMGFLANQDNPAICAPDVLNNGVKYTYENKSEFTFATPTVIAVLAATPYYNGLPYAAAQGNVGTAFGTGSGASSSVSNGIEASAGIEVGFKQDISLIVKIGEASVTAQVEGSLTYDWSTSKSVEKTISYSNYVGNADKSADSVVVAVVPEDIYFYKMADEAGSDSTEVDIAIPYAPETNIMSVKEYDSIVKRDGISNAPYINTEKVLHGAQPGNPASYPSSVDGLSNISSSSKSPSVITGSDFIGCGMGNNSAQQTIDESTSSSTTVCGSIDVGVQVEGDILGAVFGASASAGYTHSTEKTTSNSITFDGSVAGVPAGYGQYQFRWELVAYNYSIKAGNNKQKVDVISYLVQPLTGAIPPAAPKGFKVKHVGPRSATFQWDPVHYGDSSANNPVGYHVLRSSTIDGSYTVVGTISPGAATGASGQGTVTWKDTSLEPNETYYYKVEAYDGSPEVEGQLSAPLLVQTSSVLTLKVDFKVGATDHATVLVPNEPLHAIARITNAGSTPQDVIFVVALYDANGAMVLQSHKSVTVSANGGQETQAGFDLPGGVTDATAEAFLLAGSDLKSSSLVALSKVVAIGSQPSP